MPEPIFEPGPVATPFVYTVSGTGEVVPRDCQAVYNGSGAGGNYIPAVIFRSQAGHVIARAILQSTITAGDDAEVSWFPGVKAAAATPTVVVANSFVSQARTSNQSIPSGVVTALAPGIFTQGAGWNPGLFVTSGLPSGTLTFAAFGTAVFTLTVSWPVAAYDRYIELTVANAKLAEETQSPRFRVSATPDGDSMTLSAILSGGNSAPATTITANLFQASGVARAVTAMFYAQQINTHVSVF